MLCLEAVESGALALLRRIQSLDFTSGMRLAGGTALALQLGHRVSIDLDFFGEWSPVDELERHLSGCGKLSVRTAGENKLQFFYIDDVKVDCVTYSRYPWIDAPVEEEGLRLAGLKDIVAMKINAVTNRGTRKDFVDIATLLDVYSIRDMMDFFTEKYTGGFPMLALRSLLYFDDAENEPMPRMLVPFNWEAAKRKIIDAVKSML